jgi:hypothetical protein
MRPIRAFGRFLNLVGFDHAWANCGRAANRHGNLSQDIEKYIEITPFPARFGVVFGIGIG